MGHDVLRDLPGARRRMTAILVPGRCRFAKSELHYQDPPFAAANAQGPCRRQTIAGHGPASYRIRSGRFEAPKGEPFAQAMERYVRRDTPIAAE